MHCTLVKLIRTNPWRTNFKFKFYTVNGICTEIKAWKNIFKQNLVLERIKPEKKELKQKELKLKIQHCFDIIRREDYLF